MKDWAIPQSKLSANKELHNCVSNVVYRQTNKMGRFDLWHFDYGTFWLWDILTLGRFDLGRFDLGPFDLGRFDLGRFDFGTFWLGTFWLWDVLTWDVLTWDILTWDVLTWDILTLGRFDLGRFDFGTFWLGTFWLWDVLTSDVLTLGQEMFAISSLIKWHSENILGTFWLTKNGTFWQITWDVLTRYPLRHVDNVTPYPQR